MGWCADLGGLLWLHQALHLLRFSQESRPLSLLEEEEATHFIQQEPEVAGRWALPVLVSITPGTQRPGERPLQPNITQGSGAGSSLAFVPMVGVTGGWGLLSLWLVSDFSRSCPLLGPSSLD